VSETAAVSFEDVWFSYDRTNILEGVSFDVQQGKFAALLGPNGAGKTTALRLLLGIMRPSRRVRVKIALDLRLSSAHNTLREADGPAPDGHGAAAVVPRP
jgi:ABC-type multidrug transport system ATPase subunit